MAPPAGEKETRYLKSVMLERPDSLLFARLADVYRKEGDIDQAIELCINGLNTYPYYNTGRILLGRCYLEQQKTAEAIQAFTMVCSADRRNQVAIKMLADIFARQGMDRKAGDLYALLLGMDPQQPSLRQLCSRYETSGTNDLFTILGLQAPAADAPPPVSEMPVEPSEAVPEGTFIEQEQTFPDSYTQEEGGFTEPESPETAGQGFTGMTESVPDASADDISGSDISDRMSMLFSEQTGQEEQAGHSDTLEQENRGEAAFDEILTPDGEDLSGSDVSNRIEELFSDGAEQNSAGVDVSSREVPEPVGEAGIPEMPAFDEPVADTTDEIQVDVPSADISGADISDRLGELFGEESEPLQPASEPESASIVQSESGRSGTEDGSGNEESSPDGIDQMFFSDSTDSPEAVEEGGGGLQNVDLSLDSFGIQDDSGSDDIIPDLPDMDLSAFGSTGPEVLPAEGVAEFVDSGEESSVADEVAQDVPADNAMQFSENSTGGEADSDFGTITELSPEDDDSSDITGDDVLNRLSTAFDEPENLPVPSSGDEQVPEEGVGAFDPELITLDPAQTADEHTLVEEGGGAADTESTDILTGEPDADLSVEEAGQDDDPVITGEDVADRLGMVFNEPDATPTGVHPEAQPIAAGESSEQFTEEPVVSTEESDSDEMFADETIVTGNDMEERLSTLFSDEASDAPVFTAEDQSSAALELPETSFSDSGLSDVVVNDPASPAAEEMAEKGDSDDGIVTGSDMEERIATLFSNDSSVQTPDGSSAVPDPVAEEQSPEVDLPVMAFPDEETFEPSPGEGGVENSDYDGATVTDASLVTGSDMEARIDSLFSDTPPEQHDSVETGLLEEQQVDQWQTHEGNSEPDGDDNGVSGDDVSDRIDMVFNQGFPNDAAPESVENSPPENNDFSTLQQDTTDQDRVATSADATSASLAEASDTFFAEKFSSKQETEGLGVPDEELVEPDFEETMQFDSALFEEMLHPTDQSAPFMQDEQDTAVPHIDASDTEVKDDTSLSSEPIPESLHPNAGEEFTEQLSVAQSEVPQLLLDEDQEIDLASEFNSSNDSGPMHDDSTFEVTTQRLDEEVTDLIADASPEENRLDKTAVFEVNVSETQTDLVIDADDGEDQRDNTVDEFQMPSVHLDLPADVETGDHTEAVDFFEDAVEVTDSLEGPGGVAAGDAPAADDTFAGVVLVDSNEPDTMEVPPAPVPELQMLDEEFVPENNAAPAMEVLPTGATGLGPADGGDADVDGEPPEISGEDVEQRLSAMFQGDDLMSLSSDGLLPLEDEQEDAMDRVADFYTISGENAEQGTEGELPDTISDVEFDAESSIASGATVEIPLEAVHGAVAEGEAFTDKTDEILPDVELFEDVTSNDDKFAEETIAFDRRDQPFDIPDHVLTPTLADIYYQQGQHQLALEIYTRLADRDKDNEKLTERIAEIREILSTANEGGEREKEPARTEVKEPGPASGTKSKKKSSSRKPVEDPRPLAGVRIKKKVKNARKNSRKR